MFRQGDPAWPLGTVSVYKECGLQDIYLYYYPDPNTQEIDIDRTLRSMIWLFDQTPFNRTDSLSAYFSILNVFTYPELWLLAPTVADHYGLRLKPLPFNFSDCPRQRIPDCDKPLSNNDHMFVLVAYTLLLGYSDTNSYRSRIQEILARVGVYQSSLMDKFMIGESWRRTSQFMTSPPYKQLSKRMLDIIISNSSANMKCEYVLQSCKALANARTF